MGFFDVNYGRLVALMVPERLRTDLRLRWLRGLTGEVKWLYEQFMLYRDDVLYRLKHNGQVCHLEAMLNDVFDPEARGIKIEEWTYAEYVWLRLDAELMPTWLNSEGDGDPLWLRTAAEVTAADGLNRILIKVPTAVSLQANYSEVRLKALVDRDRLAGMSVVNVVLY